MVITPNPGEVAGLLQCDLGEVENDPVAAAWKAVELTGAVVILKGPHSLIATPRGDLLRYVGGGVGLATGGSGDVLAGILGGLMARGLSPLEAAAWAIWLHGEAGRALARKVGPVGYLARELIPLIPGLIVAAGTAANTAQEQHWIGALESARKHATIRVPQSQRTYHPE